MSDAALNPRHPAGQRGVLFLLGPAGSGKGTVAAALLRAGLVQQQVSMGELLRDLVHQADQDENVRDVLRARLDVRQPHADPLNEVRLALSSGRLIPDAWTETLIEESLSEPELRTGAWVLDGYPRRVGAARHLLRALGERDIPVRGVLHLRLPEAEVQRRLLVRGRADDTPDAVRQRYAVYQQEVLPTLAYLQAHLPAGTIREVDAWTPGLDETQGRAELERRALHALG